MKWKDISPEFRQAVIITLQCDASDSENCCCGREDERCKRMAEAYRAAIEILSIQD